MGMGALGPTAPDIAVLSRHLSARHRVGIVLQLRLRPKSCWARLLALPRKRVSAASVRAVQRQRGCFGCLLLALGAAAMQELL